MSEEHSESAITAAGYDFASWEQGYKDALYDNDLLARRGIEPHEEPCKKCNGAGTYDYGSTATWRGGCGGQAFTTDVCDRCWGSGKEHHPWPSHRKFYEMKKKLEAENE